MGETEGASLTNHQRHWLEHIRACEASGKSVAAYAVEHGFQVRATYDAKKILVKKGVGMYDPLGHFVYIESHGGFRDECVNLDCFLSLDNAQQ